MDFQNITLQSRLSDSLLLFYVAIASNFLVDLFPKDHIRYINNNLFIKHLLGLIIMIFSIYHLTTLRNPLQVVIIAVALYLWFLITTKLPPLVNIIIIVSLTISFLINIQVGSMEQAAYTKETKDWVNYLKRLVIFFFVYVIILTTFGYIYMMFIRDFLKKRWDF